MKEENQTLNSEIGRLQQVVLHEPGAEMEAMSPETIKEALYSDLLNEDISQKEYLQLSGVLKKYTEGVYFIDDLLEEILSGEHKEKVIDRICCKEVPAQFASALKEADPRDLKEYLILGKTQKIKALEELKLSPLYNFYFTRDIGVAFNQYVMPTKMATPIRSRESLLTELVYAFHPLFAKQNRLLLPWNTKEAEKAVLEGGDFLVASENVFLIGQGLRSNAAGVKAFIEAKIQKGDLNFSVITQELPHSPESFIHLDMVFTFLDKNLCMAYMPLIEGDMSYKTHRWTIENGILKIREEKNIREALARCGVFVELLACGGGKEIYQDREQWHSGANFFALEPGCVMGYQRNRYTIDTLAKAGFTPISAMDIINAESTSWKPSGRTVISLESSELVRGGGGCRCMTQPLSRENF